MAKKQLQTKSIEETLWSTADKLRGSVEPSEYKHIILSLIFLSPVLMQDVIKDLTSIKYWYNLQELRRTA